MPVCLACRILDVLSIGERGLLCVRLSSEKRISQGQGVSGWGIGRGCLVREGAAVGRPKRRSIGVLADFERLSGGHAQVRKGGIQNRVGARRVDVRVCHVSLVRYLCTFVEIVGP